MAVYFIKNQDTGHIKIGYSFNVLKRIKELETQFNTPLVLLGVVEGGQPKEQALHARFSKSRVSGEWFHANNDIIQFIDENSIPLDRLAETAPVNGSILQSRIKELAQAQGLETPEALSKKTGLTRTTLQNVWTGDVGKRQFETMACIARALGVTMEDLVEVSQ